VPSPAPILCAPDPAAVSVGATVQITCSAQGYVGALTWIVAQPTVVAITQFNAANLSILTVTGLSAGTTIVSFKSQPGGTGSEMITVSP
jgi:hypothetical protein